MKTIEKENFIKICNEADSMSQAASLLNIHKTTFKKYAILFNCYKPNQCGKGIKSTKFVGLLLSDILNGKYPQYSTTHLKNRLIKEKIFENKCSWCGISNWNDKEISLELDHIDGNSDNSLPSNIRLLCPHCHSQTDTFGSKGNGSRYKKATKRNTYLQDYKARLV